MPGQLEISPVDAVSSTIVSCSCEAIVIEGFNGVRNPIDACGVLPVPPDFRELEDTHHHGDPEELFQFIR